MANRAFILSVMLLFSVAGCRATPTIGRSDPAATDVAKPMLRSELIFGLSPAGPVSDAEWQAFVNEIITPAFPSGFTIVDGVGQWKDSSGKIVHERSKILILLHQRTDGSLGKLDEIRAVYKKRFGQESVIRETEKAWVVF